MAVYDLTDDCMLAAVTEPEKEPTRLTMLLDSREKILRFR